MSDLLSMRAFDLDVASEFSRGLTSKIGAGKGKAGVLLNIDIVFVILEHAYFTEKLRPDTQGFTRYSLVSKMFRIPAQRLLFHEVSIKDEIALKSIQYAVDPKRGDYARYLRDCVRVLNYWVYSKGWMNPWQRRLAPTINLFPFLYELRLGVDACRALKPETIRDLNATTPIRALQIAMRSDDEGKLPKDSIVPFQLLGVTAWELEFLVCRGERFNITQFTEYPPVKHRLIEFRWTVQNCVPSDNVDGMISYVTQNSLQTLEILSLPTLHPLITEIAPRLRSLRISKEPQSKIQTLPKSLIHLQELIWSQEDSPLPATNTFYSSLPPQLVHLGLGASTTTTGFGPKLLTKICHMLPSKLKVFTIYNSAGSGTSDSENKEFQAKDIELRIFHSVEQVNIALRSDLVRGRYYPRGVSVTNMNSMSGVVKNRDAPPVKDRGASSFLQKVTFKKEKRPATDVEANPYEVAS